MRKLLLFSLSAIAFISCQNDDNTVPHTDENQYPATLTFTESTAPEFRMWTSQQEVSTEGFDISDYMEESWSEEFTDTYYENTQLTLTGDSIIAFHPEEGEDVLAVFFRNDSLFRNVQIIYNEDTVSLDVYLARGNTNQLTTDLTFNYVNDNVSIDSFSSQLIYAGKENRIFDLENISEITDFNSLEDIQENDTLILYTKSFIYN